jgi:hypothetical protein
MEADLLALRDRTRDSESTVAVRAGSDCLAVEWAEGSGLARSRGTGEDAEVLKARPVGGEAGLG